MTRLFPALVVLMSVTAAQAQESRSAVAGIAVDTMPDGVTLRATTLALTPGRYEARMRIEKSGPSGRTSTTQGGAVTLSAGETGTVATVGLSLAPGDTLSVELVVTAGGRTVSSNRLSVGE